MTRLFRRSVAIALIVSLAACGGGGGGSTTPPVGITGGPAPTPVPIPVQSLGITAVDSNSPNVLTALHLKTTGVNTNAPVAVTFSDGAGFSSTTNAIRVAPDGTVVASVPFYLDPSTGTSGPATLSVSLTQGKATSNKISVSAQDIPQLSDYGTALGEISRTFYNYEIMALGRQLGALEALQASPKNAVSTSSAQGDTQKTLLAMINARNDIDRVMTDNSVSIPIGSLNGTAVNFDKSALAAEDRVLGWYLLTLASVSGKNGALSRSRTPLSYVKPVPWSTSYAHLSSRSRHAKAPELQSTSGVKRAGTLAASASTMKTILSGISTLGGSLQATIDFQDSISGKDPLSTKFDTVLAVAGGVAGGLVAFPAAAAVLGVSATAATLAALSIGTAAIYNHIYHEAVDISIIENQAFNGANPTLVAQAQADLDGRPLKALIDGVGTLVAAVAAAGKAGSTIFGDLANESSNVPEAADAIRTVLGLANSAQPDQDQQTAQSGANQIGAAFTTSTPELYGELSGSVTIVNSSGNTLLTGLTGVELNQGAGQPVDGSGIADPSGNYEFPVPLNNPAIPYTALQLVGYDPVQNTGVTPAITPDLSALPASTSASPDTMPQLAGSCTDDDAGSPDGDDPDCD